MIGKKIQKDGRWNEIFRSSQRWATTGMVSLCQINLIFYLRITISLKERFGRNSGQFIVDLLNDARLFNPCESGVILMSHNFKIKLTMPNRFNSFLYIIIQFLQDNLKRQESR